jgi:hypothetical protein
MNHTRVLFFILWKEEGRIVQQVFNLMTKVGEQYLHPFSNAQIAVDNPIVDTSTVEVSFGNAEALSHALSEDGTVL